MEIKLRRNAGAPADGDAAGEEKTERLTKREETIIARAITRRGHANYEAPADAIAPGFYGPAATLRNQASKASVILRLISPVFPSHPPRSFCPIHFTPYRRFLFASGSRGSLTVFSTSQHINFLRLQ